MSLQPVVEVHDGKVVGAFTSQAKNVAYGNQSVEDALDELTANGLGTRVQITSYTQSNPFTAPSDGYFIVYIQSGVEGYGCVENINCAIGGNYYDVNSNHTARYGIYVRKGMHLFCSGSPYFAAFIPIS